MLININQEADDLCKVVELAIFEHDAKGESLKLEARLQDRITGSIKVSETSDKGKGRERQEDATPTEDLGDDGLPKTPAGEEYKHKKNALQSRLRECLIVRHQVHFLLGNIYHVLGEPYTTQEDEEYAIAENIRKDLLKSVLQSTCSFQSCQETYVLYCTKQRSRWLISQLLNLSRRLLVWEQLRRVWSLIIVRKAGF